MTNPFKGLIPWQKSLNTDRSMVEFWLRIAPAKIVSEQVRVLLQKSLDKLLQLNPKTEDGKVISSVEDLFSKLELIKGNSEGSFLYFEKGNSLLAPYLSVASDRTRDYDALSLGAPENIFDLSDAELIINNISSKDFHTAYFVDGEYIHLQGQVHKNRYKFTGGLKIDKSWGDKNRVMTKGRPGKIAALPDKSGHLETGAAHFWFGELVYNTIPKERILSFKQAHEIRELSNGVIYVNLYDGTFNGHLPENQAKQEAFKVHLGLIQK